ncbi:MAG: hypothetical protein Q7S74_03625 [Nanoarchaeota archaeon]|nr:hypothetical protein [Nanoarchaeota archaeon]
MEIVASVGTDKENWGQILALLNRAEYEKAIIVKNRNAESFPVNDRCIVIEIDSSLSLVNLKSYLLEKLKKELSGDFEVNLSIASGTGKEHMALVSALLSVPVGIRLVAYTKEGIEFLT